MPWVGCRLDLISVGVAPSVKRGAGHVVSMGISELRCPDRGGVTHGVGDGVELAAVVAVGDPHGLAVMEAGCLGEDHGLSVGGTDGSLQGRRAGVNTPTTPGIRQYQRGRERCHSRCGSHPSRSGPLLPGRQCSSGWSRCLGR